MAYPYYPNYQAWGNYNNPLMPPTQMPQQQVQPTQTPPTPMTDINWVQGEADAKARPVLAGHSAIFMDSEESLMYIKTVDQSGVPQPLRVFEYTERKPTGQSGDKVRTIRGQSEDNSGTTTDLVTRSEFDALAEKVNKLIEGEGEG